MHSSGAGYTLSYELPGIPASRVRVARDDRNRLLLRASDSSSDRPVLHQVVPLPPDSNPSAARASMLDGLLRVALPKSPGQQPQPISIADSIPVKHSDNEYYVRVQVPGLSRDELSANVEADRSGDLVFVLKGSSNRNLADDISRSFSVPRDADLTQAQCGCENGLLALRVPKAQHALVSRNANSNDSTTRQEVQISENRDFNDESDTLLLKESMPGMKPSNLKCEVRGNSVTLRGEVESRDDTMRSYRSISRSSTLPEGADASAVKAQYADGQLRVYLPSGAIKEPEYTDVQIATDRHVSPE